MNKKLPQNHTGLEMYFLPKIAKKYAELEQNDKNFRLAEIVDRTIMQEINGLPDPIYAAELGGGAHPDRYHKFFKKLLTQPKGHIDWVDIAPQMLKLAKQYISNEKYKNREEVISFIESEMLGYLKSLKNERLDLAIMKYTFDFIKNLDKLFKLLAKKLKKGGKLIATIGNLSPELKSYSTNARFLYNGKQFPDNETRTLKDGDNFTIKFFKVSGDPNSGYIEGAETVKFFYSAKKIKRLSKFYNFDIFLGDWKEFVKSDAQDKESMDQGILVLTKK
ncbi:MAG: methyltransferase domain-containing protein [Candidatus Buchananbacteria bacterium]|jgi:ubiquinone/menaquinone biosynthesis C-methylase UbiE